MGSALLLHRKKLPVSRCQKRRHASLSLESGRGGSMRSHRLKVIFALLLAMCGISAHAQTCVPGNGVQCTPNLNLWLPPFNYPQWNIPMNANFNTLDTLSTTL